MKFSGGLSLLSVGDTTLEQGDGGRVEIGTNRFLTRCRVTNHLGLPGTEDLTVLKLESPEQIRMVGHQTLGWGW